MIDINKFFDFAGKILNVIFPAGWKKRKEEKRIENEYKKKIKEIDKGITGKKDISIVTNDILSGDEPRLPKE